MGYPMGYPMGYSLGFPFWYPFGYPMHIEGAMGRATAAPLSIWPLW